MQANSAKQKVIEIPPLFKAIKSNFNYLAAWTFLQDKGKELYGPKFRLHIEDAEPILKLVVWFMQDEELAPECNIDLQKGILLVGPVGCGKTSLMNICRFLLPAQRRHAMKSCRDISFEFIKEGYDIFHRYTNGSFNQAPFEPKTFCFDDLGLENVMNYYGNQCSAMAEILLSRYDLFHQFDMLTHLTTNLNSKEIEEMYGLRVRSRLREMCNLVVFGQISLDKRI